MTSKEVKIPCVLFLYTELGGYTFACMKKLAAEGVEVHVVHFPVNAEAPFQFASSEGLTLYVNTAYNRTELLDKVLDIKPDLVFCSGWVNKEYLFVCRKLQGRATLVMCMDNQWRATPKQYVGSCIARFSFLRIFDKTWVPGTRQVEYARRMGFSLADIHTGFYCCDVNLYQSYYASSLEKKMQEIPKRFLYVGRYFDYKGITDLWSAFVKLQQNFPNEWELWCVGMGTEVPVQHPQIKHFGFVQPQEMGDIVSGSGVFVMPSRFDQWGVALQEFAIAGFPLICSNRVGASDTYLKQRENGFLFQGEDVEDLMEAMKKTIASSPSTLKTMAQKSHELGLAITPETWVKTVKDLLQERQVN
jgi:glycosyltransferase involved in cell wall biosynthesis